MKYVWNDKCENSKNGFVEAVLSDSNEGFEKCSLYVDKPCRIIVNNSAIEDIVSNYIITASTFGEKIKSIVIKDANINFNWEGVY
ncbi:hypothetical protein ACQKMI_10600 [Lysinibacillus sp. NPDC097214]|uniref:hypothetical protein n=1 Tax=Lysinibacillus sp. NPDC097214 TaxID=3390584 RepID=UPI003D072033